ncbi:GNAT family N-acetyltransferase [Actinoplanes sp. RD1]|uniref:GNAT family N-acetyltransferase n=1 Tax=Actinoplanes sp. RD1 TaxID=3064538 RepID=UPI002740F9C0|nr:GNAT family N-acetyltransferase [Actinoplanes sp. RD1]
MDHHPRVHITPLTPADHDDAYAVARASAEHETPEIPFWSRAGFLGRIEAPWPGSTYEFFLARLDDGTPAGFLEAGFPESGTAVNLHLAVHPEHRRRGVGRALYALAVERARALGRKHLIAPAIDRLPDGPAFAAAMGAVPGLPEVRSRLDVPDAVAAPPVAAGYRLVQWVDHAPDEYVDDIAYLDSRLLADAPTGDLAWEPEKVDAARVREAEEAIVRRNRTAFHTGAVHVATDRLVAWTMITCPDDVRWQAWQQITIVDPPHRGHGLGLTVKAANLAFTRADRPELRAVDTFNAAENAPMLAVNEALGYRRRETWVQWQATL